MTGTQKESQGMIRYDAIIHFASKIFIEHRERDFWIATSIDYIHSAKPSASAEFTLPNEELLT